MPHNLTRRQYQVLQAIRQWSQEKGYMPSVRQVGSILQLSAATIQQHLNALRKKGYLDTDGTAHGLRLLVEGDDIPTTRAQPNQSGAIEVPVVGTIAAGSPIEAVANVEQILELAPELARPGDYLLHVSGSSMIEDGILDGDLVLIRPQSRVENGQTAVGLLEDGTVTLKRIYREGKQIRLQPANQSMSQIYVDHIQLQGRVVGLIRIYE